MAPKSYGTFQDMADLLGQVGPTVLKETWGYYRLAPKEVDGVPKWTGWLLVSDEGDSEECQVGNLADINNSREIVANKLSLLQGGVETSISRRNPKGNPPLWGGAAITMRNHRDGLTGGTELQDHIVLGNLQLATGCILKATYEERMSLEYPGIRDSIADSKELGLNPGSYVSMRSSIEAHFRAAGADLAA